MLPKKITCIKKCIDSFQDEMDQDCIWCMLTDVLSYTVEENPPSCSYFKPIHTPNESDIRVYTLLDTGATKPILHKRFYERTPFMHTYPKYKITPRSIKIADNNLINVTECIKFPVSFAGHHFEFIAFLVDIIDDFDFVIGSKSMFELEADMKYSNLTFEFAKRSIKLIPTRSYTCPPHQCKSIKMKLIDWPPDFHSGTVVAKMITSREDKLPQTVRLNIVNGYTSLSLCNETDKPLHIARGRNLGCVDMFIKYMVLLEICKPLI